MKILIISDIHSNYQALKELDYYIKSVDKVFCLGDIVGYHCEVNEVINYLRENKVTCIAGNHDRYLVSKKEIGEKVLNESVLFGLEYAEKVITLENLNWLSNLPTSISYVLENISIFCCHGSPWNVTNEYLYSNKLERLNELQEFDFNILCYGHTHRKELVKKNEKKIILNPGSVGQARDVQGKVCATIIDTNTFEIENLELNYNYLETIKIAKENGAREYIYKHFKI